MPEPQQVRIIVKPNGPYFVEGEATVVDPEGHRYESAKPGIALCRCGGSAGKPFCDGSHRRIGFEAAEPATAASSVGGPERAGG